MSPASGVTRRSHFRGQITGLGSTSGVRVVVGDWRVSPYGVFADAMVQRPDGHRVLVAPSREVADFVAATYSFDEVRVEPVVVERDGDARHLTSPSLDVRWQVGGRTWLGRILLLVPRRVAEQPWWCALTDPVARVVLPGVRTRGSAGHGRREWYGATGHRAVTSLRGTWDGADLGALARLDPPATFGFSSTPPRPSLTDLVTTVDHPAT